MGKTDSAIIGACGEHYVASYLSGFKLIVAMPRAGVPGSDMFVSDVKNGPALRVQVKTGTQARRKTKAEGEIFLWYASKRAITNVSRYLWYAFVYLDRWPEGDREPTLLIVPSHVVAAQVKKCLDADEMLFFWLPIGEAEPYRGSNGLKQMLAVLESEAARD